MRKFIDRSLILLLVVTMALPLLAQDSGGQLWVQAFEDRNGNGQHDAGEPFLTQSVSVDLLNADGVVVASGALDGAPYASRGYIGFLYLDPGTYTAVITSPELTPTTPDRVDVTITADALPVTVLYGAERAAVASMTAAPVAAQQRIGAGGALRLRGAGRGRRDGVDRHRDLHVGAATALSSRNEALYDRQYARRPHRSDRRNGAGDPRRAARTATKTPNRKMTRFSQVSY